MALDTQIKELSKEAGILRAYHKEGKYDFSGLDNFLSRVENLNAPGSGKKKQTRFQRQHLSFKLKKAS